MATRERGGHGEEARAWKLLVRVINLARRGDRREWMQATLPSIPGTDIEFIEAADARACTPEGLRYCGVQFTPAAGWALSPPALEALAARWVSPNNPPQDAVFLGSFLDQPLNRDVACRKQWG